MPQKKLIELYDILHISNTIRKSKLRMEKSCAKKKRKFRNDNKELHFSDSAAADELASSEILFLI